MELVARIFSRRMISCFLLGMSSGLPLLLVGSTLQAWMTESGVSLAEIGLVALVGLPYNVKFLWSPLVDRYALPFLGRRRGWIVIFQLSVGALLMLLGVIGANLGLFFMMLLAMILAFFSASQDIVIDAYRREILSDEELGLGSSLFIGGYRIGLLMAGAVALHLAQMLQSWHTTYIIMGALALGSTLFTLLSPLEVSNEIRPKTIKDAVIKPFSEFFSRPEALWILAFILLYKVGDAIATNMIMPFFLKMDYSKAEIANMAKIFGLMATIGGSFLGGVILLKTGIRRGLLIFGIFQAITTLSFLPIYYMPHHIGWLGLAVGLENLASGMGTSAFVGYLAALTNRQYTATQYSLLTSLMAVPRTVLASPAGLIVDALGWDGFFIFCSVIAIPALFLIPKVTKS